MKRFNSSKWITENKHGKNLTEGMSPEEWADAKEKERLNQHPEKDTINKIKKMMDKEKPLKEEMTAPSGWTEITDLSDMHYSEEDGEIAVKAWDAPMEGWDEEHKDIIIIRKDDSGFYLDGYVPFGDFEMQGPFNTYEEVFKLAVEEMEAFKEDWDEEKNEDYKPSVRAYNVIDKSNNDEIVAKELPRHKALELAKTNKDYMISATDRMAETDAISTARSIRPSGEKDEEQDEYDKGWYGESLKEVASKLGYLNEAEYGKYFGGRTKGGDKEVDGMEGGMDPNAMQYQKVTFVYTEQGGRFYGLDVYVSKDQPQRSDKLRYDEANEWLKDTLNYIHEDDLIPRKYISGLEDLDLIVDRLKELNIEASHNDFMDVS
jgi:hypothetical protein